MTSTVEATTIIHVETCDYWVKCACGYSMRIPSPNDSMATLKMPVFCCGCGKQIAYTGQHRWLPHDFIPRGVATMRWGGKEIGDIIPGCGLCGAYEADHLPKNPSS